MCNTCISYSPIHFSFSMLAERRVNARVIVRIVFYAWNVYMQRA